MKTAADIDDEMEAFRKENATEFWNKNVSKRLLFLKNCKLYLANEPTEVHVQKQLAEVKNKIVLITKGYSVWLANTPNPAQHKNPLKWYSDMMNKKDFVAQEKMLEHLL